MFIVDVSPSFIYSLIPSFLDYCYINLKFIPVIIKTILNVYRGCFHTVYLLFNFLFLDYCYIDLKFFPVILKNRFKCSCKGARYYISRKVNYPWENRLSIGVTRRDTRTWRPPIFKCPNYFSLCCNFRRVVLQSHYISINSLPFNMS